MDEFDNDEIIGGMEVGEMMDLNAGQSHTDDGSAAPEALEDLQSNAYGKGTRPKKSIVHSEMEVVTFPDGTKKWKCKWCGALYTFDEKWKSTSNGKKHLLVCLQRKLEKGSFEKEASQSRLSFGDGDTSIGSWKYNHHKVREIAAHMVLGHEFPFTIMEGAIFNRLLREIYPGYKRITRHVVKTDCETFHKEETIKMKKVLSMVDRVSLTTDLWWSGEQKIGYMTVTGHYIDSKWQLHKRVLAFTNVPPPHTGEVLARELLKVMDDWHIRDKVVSISVDNASANDSCIARLKTDFSNRRNLPLEGQLFHVRCCAHILNLLVQDGLDIIKPVVDKIRSGVKYLLNSETRCKQFKKIVVELQLQGKMQVLDTKTRWNSTWLMLSTAYFYKDVWPRYAEENGAFIHYLPDDVDWEIVYDICKFLEVFADVTEIISGTSYPTVNLFLAELYRVKVLLDKHSEGSEKPHLQILASEMKLKYDKYWSQSNILISIGAVLDPRYKMIFIAWVYPFLYPDGDEAKTFETLLSKNLESLFKLYETKYKKDFSGSTIQTQGVSTSTGLGKRSFEMFLESVQGNSLAKSDLESYLEEVPLKCPAGGVKFDVLTWWMANEAKYPILSKLAKDILSIPVTTVASESTFSAGKRVIDPKRASMKTSTVEMLLCGGDWVKEMYGIKKGSKAPEENDVEETLQFDFGSVTPDELSTQRGATTSNLQQP